MKTLGLTNACVDQLVSGSTYPEMSYNNTYGVHFIPESFYEGELHNFSKPNGCIDLIKNCRALGEAGDPDWTRANATVNAACILATQWCTEYVVAGLIEVTNRTLTDAAVEHINGNDPCPFYLPAQTYLNQPHVQAALGVPVNFTYDSNVVASVFGAYNSPSLKVGTGDPVRKGIKDLEDAMAGGVNVAMVYGDRDFICSWMAGEAIAENVDWKHKAGYQKAGWREFVTSDSYSGGVSKQFGRLSFTRVFDAGHSVSAYKPETVYRVFMRSMFGKDVATGEKEVGETFSTKGPSSALGWRNKLPAEPPESCMVQGKFQEKSHWADLEDLSQG